MRDEIWKKLFFGLFVISDIQNVGIWKKIFFQKNKNTFQREAQFCISPKMSKLSFTSNLFRYFLCLLNCSKICCLDWFFCTKRIKFCLLKISTDFSVLFHTKLMLLSHTTTITNVILLFNWAKNHWLWCKGNGTRCENPPLARTYRQPLISLAPGNCPSTHSLPSIWGG